MERKRTHMVFLPLCLMAVATLIGPTAHASSMASPFGDEHTVAALLGPSAQVGQAVICDATVGRIGARNNPPFFVLRDEVRTSAGRVNKIAVLGRPPQALATGQVVHVEGVLGQLPNGEPCILNPVVALFVDNHGRALPWAPLFQLITGSATRLLPVPAGPIPPSDPSLPNDGTGTPGNVSAGAVQTLLRFANVSALLSAAPPLLSRVALACMRTVSVGQGFIVAGDDTTTATVKVYTRARVRSTDRVVRIVGVVHSENGRLVIYTDQGPEPYYDSQGPGGSVTVADSGTVAAAKSGKSGAPEPTAARSLSTNPPQIDGGDVDLTGKVVTAVFYLPGSQTVSSFYIQEPTVGGNGIKVLPGQPCSLVLGDIVHVAGAVIPSSATVAECYVQGSTVEVTGYQLIPPPAGMAERTTAGGTFGLQQALYVDATASPGTTGTGLSAVGSQVRIWGRVTWRSQDGTVCFVDDGSALKSTYAGQLQTGLRVIFPQACPATLQVGDYAEDIAGVLGAELSEDSTPLPVPVLRVVCSAQGQIIHVKWDSPGPVYDGQTWATAFHSIQGGINAAASGDEVWVAAGTYAGNITLAPGVRVYGAFDGTETVRQSERPWAANLTTIQGDGTDSVVYAGSGIASTTVLDGFTIAGGGWGRYVDEQGSYYGSGICCQNASPVISDDVISGNGDPVLTTGGGIGCYGGSPTISDSVITGNQAFSGGGIACSGGGPAITDDTITGNQAYSGGGIFCSQGTPQIARNLVNQNAGGGIYLDTVTGAVVINNAVTWNSDGGVYTYNAAGRFANNAVTYNSVTYYTGGGGLYILNEPSPGALAIVNNTVAYNTAPVSGGGIVLDSCSPSLVNNIVASNEGGQVEKTGSGGSPSLHANCIFGDTPYSGWTTNPSQDILVDPHLMGFHIQSGSPCLNAGDNSVVQAGDVDIDNEPRIQPTGDPNAVVDIGADEYNPADVAPAAPVTETDLDYFSSLATYCGN